MGVDGYAIRGRGRPGGRRRGQGQVGDRSKTSGGRVEDRVRGVKKSRRSRDNGVVDARKGAAAKTLGGPKTGRGPEMGVDDGKQR